VRAKADEHEPLMHAIWRQASTPATPSGSTVHVKQRFASASQFQNLQLCCTAPRDDRYRRAL